MHKRLLTILALTGAPLLTLSATAPHTAQAQEGLFAEPLVELLPGTPIYGNAQGPVDVHVLLLGTDGAPMTGVTGKVTAAAGEADKFEEVSPGIYRIRWTPPRAAQASSVELTIRARTADRQNLTRTVSVPMQPVLASGIKVTSNPEQIVLGQDASATLTMTLAAGPGQPLDDADLLVDVSVGTITNLTNLGGGKFSALYTPPNKPYPHIATITVADKRDPSNIYGTYALPLVGKASFPVTAAPNSRVMLRIADRDFGPVQADATGRASVPIVVPPGYGQATLTSIVGSDKKEEVIDLQLPVTPRVQIVPTHSTVPADASLTVPLRVFVAQPNGQPDTTAQVTFSTTAGRVSAARHEAGGVYVADFTPPYANAASQVTIQVSVADTRGAQTDSLTVNLSPARPASVTLSAEPPRLSGDAASFLLYAKVIGQDGIGVSGRQPRFFANGARLTGGGVKDLGNGDYQARFATTGEGGAALSALVLGEAGQNPVASVLLVPDQQRLTNDGVSTTIVNVIAVDSFGYPVPNVAVSLKVLSGGGSLPSSVTTDTTGTAQLNYTAGREVGLAHLQATVGGRVSGVGILQLPASAAGVTELPISGPLKTVAAFTAWQKASGSLRIEREGATGIIAATDVSGAAGPLARIRVTPEPASAAPGGTVTLRIRAEDSEGRGKAGIKLDYATTLGAIGAVTDLGGGDYSAPLVLSPDASGEAKVTVASTDGAIVGFIKIPISGAAVATSTAWGTDTNNTNNTNNTTGNTNTTDPEPVRVRPPREPREPGEYPWLRTQAAYRGGLYSYNQTPLTATSPLYDQSIVFGGGTTAAAASAGLDLRARAFLPTVPYVGFDLGYGGSSYAVAIPQFEDPVVDWLHDFSLVAVGRYPLALGGSQLHLGGRAGFQLDDFILYRQEVEDSQRFLVYEPLFVRSLLLGGELNAELGSKAFTLLTADFGLAGGSAFYRTDIALTVGYSILDNLYAHVGGNIIGRSSSLYNEAEEKIGDLQDGSTIFTVGVGYQR